MSYSIKVVNSEDWQRLRELRLAALADPIAVIAFLEDHKAAAAQPDEFWQRRAANSALGRDQRVFVGSAENGTWAGMLVVLVEESRTHIVGVYMRPEHRGTGLAHELFREALDWSWQRGAEQVRLWVHEENTRAEKFYAAFGFVRTGEVIVDPKNPEAREYEMALFA
jgi:ribosomal protein S18 acetylase RimI-like enzyme